MLCNNTNCGMSYLSTSPFSSGIGEQSPITPSADTVSWHHHHSILAFHVSPSSVNSPQPRSAAVLIFYEWRKKPTSFSSKKKKQLWEYAESKRWKSALKSAKAKALSCQTPTSNSIDRYSSISPSASAATHLSSSSTATTSPESKLTSTSPESQSTSPASQPTSPPTQPSTPKRRRITTSDFSPETEQRSHH